MIRGLDKRHPATAQVARWFDFQHLPAGLPRDVSTVFSVTVDALLEELPDGPELTKALNAMLEAKDWAVRAAILLPPQTGGPA